MVSMTSARTGCVPAPRVAYIAGSLPCRSETFVYRELLELRRVGLTVEAVSVRTPARDLGVPGIDRLAEESIVLYGDPAALVRDAAGEVIHHPIRSLSTLCRALRDAVLERDIRLGSRPKTLIQAITALALARRLRARGVTHLHAHMAHVPTTIAMYAAMQMGVLFSFTGHAADLFRDRAMLGLKLARAAFTSCISEWHQEFYQWVLAQQGAGKQLETKLPLVRCGVDMAEFAPRADRKPGTRILAVGRLVPKKGFDILLEALSRLVKEGRPVVCDLVGEGPERDPLERQREDLGLVDRVRFCGALSNHRVREMMQRADLFVLPCRVAGDGDRDGIPVVLMEAMACGVCVITGDLPTIRELVIPGKTGILVKPGEVDALATAIGNVLEDPRGYAAMARAGLNRVKDEFTISGNVRRLRRAICGEEQGIPPVVGDLADHRATAITSVDS